MRETEIFKNQNEREKSLKQTTWINNLKQSSGFYAVASEHDNSVLVMI
jgi:hypothetical protein